MRVLAKAEGLASRSAVVSAAAASLPQSTAASSLAMLRSAVPPALRFDGGWNPGLKVLGYSSGVPSGPETGLVRAAHE